MLVRLLERFQINDAALGLLRDLDRAGVQRLGVAQQEPVRHIGNGAGGFHRLLGVVHAQPQHHLALPEGDGVHDGGLDLLGHEKVVILDHADLRGHLQGDRAGQLQIVQLLLKAADEVREIVHGLRVLGQTGLHRFRAQLGEILFAQLLHAELARDDVHRELLEIRLIELKHAVERGNVLREDDLVVLQLLGDLVHIDFGLVELRLRLLHGAGGLFEKTAETLLLLGFVVVEILQFHDEAREHVADLAHVLRAHLAERGAGEIGNVLLRGGAVGKNKIRIGHVDLLGKLAHGGLLLGGETVNVELFRLNGGLFLFNNELRSGGGFLRGGLRGIERQGRNVSFFIHGRCFLSSFVRSLYRMRERARPRLRSAAVRTAS